MFVLNCVIVKEETLTYNPKSGKKGQKRRRGKDKGNVTEEQSAYHPVKCHECNTEVAVYDHDEVFHFFNVLASAPWSKSFLFPSSAYCINYVDSIHD